MPETDFAAFQAKTPGDRTTMHVLYALHTIAPFTMWTLSIVAVIVNYVKRPSSRGTVRRWIVTSVSPRPPRVISS